MEEEEEQKEEEKEEEEEEKEGEEKRRRRKRRRRNAPGPEQLCRLLSVHSFQLGLHLRVKTGEDG